MYHDLVPFLQFKKRENTPPWVFFTFFKISEQRQSLTKYFEITLQNRVK